MCTLENGFYRTYSAFSLMKVRKMYRRRIIQAGLCEKTATERFEETYLLTILKDFNRAPSLALNHERLAGLNDHSDLAVPLLWTRALGPGHIISH